MNAYVFKFGHQSVSDWDDAMVVCHLIGDMTPGIHYWDYSPSALNISQVTATHLKIGHP